MERRSLGKMLPPSSPHGHRFPIAFAGMLRVKATDRLILPRRQSEIMGNQGDVHISATEAFLH
jgi:hypothetical protein